MTCDKCGKIIRFNEFYYGYDRNHYKGINMYRWEQDWYMFKLCKQCDELLQEFVTGVKEGGRK